MSLIENCLAARLGVAGDSTGYLGELKIFRNCGRVLKLFSALICIASEAYEFQYAIKDMEKFNDNQTNIVEYENQIRVSNVNLKQFNISFGIFTTLFIFNIIFVFFKQDMTSKLEKKLTASLAYAPVSIAMFGSDWGRIDQKDYLGVIEKKYMRNWIKLLIVLGYAGQFAWFLVVPVLTLCYYGLKTCCSYLDAQPSRKNRENTRSSTITRDNQIKDIIRKNELYEKLVPN